MNKLEEIKSVITALSERVNELEEKTTNIVRLDDFLELQRENAVILEKLTADITSNENQNNEKMLSLLKKVQQCLIPKPEVTPEFIIPQNEVDSLNKRIDDIKAILNGECPEYPDGEYPEDSDSDDESIDMDMTPLIVDNEVFASIYVDKIEMYIATIYDHLDSPKFWRTIVGTPVHAKINMLTRRLKVLLNVEDLGILDGKRDKVTRYVKALSSSIKSAYDIAESSVLWELESISEYILRACDEASKWRYNKSKYTYIRKESDGELSTSKLPLQFIDNRNDAIDARLDAAIAMAHIEKECASSENNDEDSDEDSSESDVYGTQNVNDAESIQTMETKEPSEETSEIEAEGTQIGLILEESESNNATSQNEASSDVNWDEVATCLFGYVNSAKRWINNDSVGDTGQIQIINHMGNLLSTKSADISGSYPIFAKTLNQLALDAKKPVKLPATIEEFAETITDLN